MVNPAGAPIGGGFAFTYTTLGNTASGVLLSAGIAYVCTPATVAKSYVPTRTGT